MQGLQWIKLDQHLKFSCERWDLQFSSLLIGSTPELRVLSLYTQVVQIYPSIIIILHVYDFSFPWSSVGLHGMCC